MRLCFVGQPLGKFVDQKPNGLTLEVVVLKPKHFVGRIWLQISVLGQSVLYWFQKTPLIIARILEGPIINGLWKVALFAVTVKNLIATGPSRGKTGKPPKPHLFY